MPFFKDFKNISAPKQSYNFKAIIQSSDYSGELTNVRIVASIYVPYLIYVLDFLVDSNDLIQEKIYGQNSIKFKIASTGDVGFLMESDYVELMIIHSAFLLTQKDKLSREKQIDRTPFRVICVERKNFQIATKMVNDIYQGKKIKEILESMAKKLNVKLSMDEDGLNKIVINQIMIPPTSLCSAIKQHIDKPFGIYNAPYQIRIDHVGDKDKEPYIYLRNLSKQMQSQQNIIIHQLATGNTDNMKIIEKCGDGINFYTNTVHRSNFNANPVFASLATVSKHIVKPLDGLYDVITQKLDEVCQKSGLMSKKDGNIPYDEALKDRTKYYTGNTGYGKDKTFADAMMSKKLTNLANMSMIIERAFKIHNLLEVGKPVKFNTYITEYANLAGVYILSGTDLVFNKEKTLQWNSAAKIRLIRSHKEI
jgi:hypothetical protein